MRPRSALGGAHDRRLEVPTRGAYDRRLPPQAVARAATGVRLQCTGGRTASDPEIIRHDPEMIRSVCPDSCPDQSPLPGLLRFSGRFLTVLAALPSRLSAATAAHVGVYPNGIRAAICAASSGVDHGQV